MYLDLPELESMALSAHAVRRGEVFVDVRANIGAHSAFAAVVPRYRVIGLGPIAKIYRQLCENVPLNGRLDRVTAPRAGARGLLRNPDLLAVIMEFGCGSQHGSDDVLLVPGMLPFGIAVASHDPPDRRPSARPRRPIRPDNAPIFRDPVEVLACSRGSGDQGARLRRPTVWAPASRRQTFADGPSLASFTVQRH